METTEKMTYARKTLWALLSERKLKAWCKEHNLPHTTTYKVATGDSLPTYAVICSMLPFIPYTDWFYFDGEEIPYERRTIEFWDPAEIPAYIRQHKHEWVEQGRHFGMTEAFARNLFVNHRARPTLNMIRQAALEGTDPIEFFIAGDMGDNGIFYPERGDIVELFGKLFVVLSQMKWNQSNSAFYGVEIIKDKPDLISSGIQTFQRKYPKFVDKADPAVVTELSLGLVSLVQ